MQEVLAYIRKRTEEQRSHPFIKWLDDDSVPPHERLTRWFPNNAGFAMGFKDLNLMILRYPDEEAAKDPFKRAINHHGEQDGTHWEWYLRDLQKLKLDRDMSLSEALRFLWNRETRVSRRFMYGLCALANRNPDPLIRYSMIMPLEEFAHLLFGKLAKIARAYAKEKAIKLEYLGDLHAEHEPGDLVNQEDEKAQRMFMDIRLSDDKRRVAIAAAQYVCDENVTRWMTNYKLASENRLWPMD
jgi:hypothetical protein